MIYILFLLRREKMKDDDHFFCLNMENEYANEQLNELNYERTSEDQGKAKLFQKYNKNEKMISNMNDNLKEIRKAQEELTKKLGKAKNLDEVKIITSSPWILLTIMRNKEKIKGLMENRRNSHIKQN